MKATLKVLCAAAIVAVSTSSMADVTYSYTTNFLDPLMTATTDSLSNDWIQILFSLPDALAANSVYAINETGPASTYIDTYAVADDHSGAYYQGRSETLTREAAGSVLGNVQDFSCYGSCLDGEVATDAHGQIVAWDLLGAAYNATNGISVTSVGNDYSNGPGSVHSVDGVLATSGPFYGGENTPNGALGIWGISGSAAVPTSPVPEPGSVVLMLGGLGVLVLKRRGR